MSETQVEEPAPVEDGCPLVPWVPRSLVVSVLVKRVVEMEGGQRALITLPVSFGPDDDEIALAKVAGGGVFVAQARGAKGTFLKGYPTKNHFLDGPEKQVGTVQAEDLVPPAPPAPVSSPVPPMVAGTGIPIASPLPGMPGYMMDIPGLPASERAWVARFDVALAHVVTAHREATAGRVASAERFAEAEKETARHSVELAKMFVDKVSAPSLERQSRAVDALADALKSEREAHAATRAELGSVREKLGEAQKTAAFYQTVLQVNGRIESGKAPGFAGLFERLVGLTIKTLGPGAVGLIASQLGITPEDLRQLTGAVVGGETAVGELSGSATTVVRSA